MGFYLRPQTLSDTLTALAAERYTILSGATDHFPTRVLTTPAENILDISAVAELDAIRVDGAGIWIPARATWRAVIDAGLPASAAALVAAARGIGGQQVQNAATVIGNLCNASPAADGIPVLLALDAEVELARLGERRRLPVAEFVLGNRRTARAPDELVLGLHIPRPAGPARSVFEKLGARAYLVISIVMVALAAEFLPDGRIAALRAAVGACSSRALRLPALEAALLGRHPDPALVTAAHLAPLTPIDDVRASAAYRRGAALTLLRRAVTRLGEPEIRPARKISA